MPFPKGGIHQMNLLEYPGTVDQDIKDAPLPPDQFLCFSHHSLIGIVTGIHQVIACTKSTEYRIQPLYVPAVQKDVIAL